MDWNKKRTWAEIDLEALEHNYRALRAMLAPSCRYLGVVKADAYGHGAIPIARKLQELGCEMLAVACLDEAIKLRENGIHVPILIFGQTPLAFAEELLRYDLTQAVGNEETAQQLSKIAQRVGRTLNIHIKVDSGMTRLGFLWREELREQTADAILRVTRLPGLNAEGIFTHCANADEDEEYTMLQYHRFVDCLAAVEEKGKTFAVRHCAASAAMLNYPCTHMDMVRPGIATYGHYPAPSTVGKVPQGLRPVMSVFSRVVAVRDVPVDTAVSYGCTHRLGRNSRLAVLPMGYGDGFFRLLSNRFWVEFEGRRAPVVGRICMDMCMVDVTELPDVRVDDVATIFGANKPLEEAASLVDTIQYELLCDVSPRVPRIYLP